MYIKIEQLPSKYTNMRYEYDSDGIFYIKFIPERKVDKFIGFYPIDMGFDDEGEINSLVILWPFYVWRQLNQIEFPKGHTDGRLIFKALSEDDDEYSFDVYTTPDLSTLYLESERAGKGYVNQLCLVNDNFLVEIDKENHCIIRLWFRNTACAPSLTPGIEK
jgi:hypothetical protein